MKDNSLSVAFTTSATPQKAIVAISNVSGWWATNVKGSSARLNDVFTVRFGKTFSIIKVVEIIPDHKMVWLIIDCDLPLFPNPKEWLSTRIIWEITSKNQQTTVRMTHDGLTPDLTCYYDCKKGWTYYVTESLRKLISKRTGLPGAGIFSYIMSGQRKYDGLLYFKNDPLPDYPEGSLCVDVKATKGEEVITAHSVTDYNKDKLNPSTFKGDYFMVMKDVSETGDTPFAQDIRHILNVKPEIKI